MSKMDFSGFKKIAQDDHVATFRHEKLGHELRIAHKGLSPKLKGQLDALPIHNFAEGGGVSEADEAEIDPSLKAAPPAAAPAPAVEGVYQDTSMGVPAGSGAESTPVSTGSADAPQTKTGDTGPGPANPPNPVNSDPTGAGAALQGQIGALGEQKTGQQMIAQAQGNLGTAQAGVEAEHQNQLAVNQANYEKANQELTAERAGIQNDIAKGHIDPTHYLDNMSTGKEIRTGIGLILGGMGAGLTHGPNLAFQYLQNQIDRDIDSQKSELGKKQNLLQSNLHQTQNLRAASELTRIQTNDIFSSKLRQEADKTANPVARGTMLNIAGMFDNKTAQLQHQYSLTKMQQAAFSGNGQASPLVMESLPPDQRERAVQMPGGGLRLATTKKGAEEVREQLQTIQPIFDSLDQLASLGPSALIGGTPANQKAKAIQAQLIPEVNSNAGLKRLSAEDIGNIREMFTDPTKFSSLAGGAKTAAFKSFLQNKLVSTMSNQLEGVTGKRSPAAGQNFGFTPKKYSSR